MGTRQVATKPTEMSSEELMSVIREIFDDPDAWLDAPNARLGGLTPRECLGTQNEQHLHNLIRAIQLGFPS